MVAEKPNKKIQSATASLLSSVGSFISSKLQRNTQDDEELKIEQLKKDMMKQPGKKVKVEWDEITASCAYKHSLILGFGNGAVIQVAIDNSKDVA